MVPAAPSLHHWAAEASVQRSLSSVLFDGTESSAAGEIPRVAARKWSVPHEQRTPAQGAFDSQ
jgi:hypothetical protein